MCRGREPVAPTDRRDHQVQGGVFGVIAFLQQVLGSFLALPDLHEARLILVEFAEVETQAALTFSDGNHGDRLSR
jgi:hypothetical protein